MGAPELAPLGAALEDRNRTAPIPFCGNRFELRAVGSNANVAFSMTMLNTIVAEGLSQISAKVDAGTSVRDAVGEILNDSMPAMFNGDGYDTAWHHEAEFDRGLLNLPTTVDALKHFNSEKNYELFEKHQVFSKGEVEAVTSIMYERYYLDCEIEAKTMLNMLNQGILPACAADLTAYDGTGLAGSRAEVYSEVAAETAALAAVVDAWPQDDEATAAQYAKDTVKPAMDAARAAQDAAELLIDSDKYPYPTYFDMLFPHHSDGRL
jgi:glutamine synthetase